MISTRWLNIILFHPFNFKLYLTMPFPSSTRLDNLLLLQKPEVLQDWHDGLSNFLKINGYSCNLYSSSSIDNVIDCNYDLIITPMFDWVPTLLISLAPSMPWIHFTASGVNTALAWDIDLSNYLVSKSNGIHSVCISEYVLGAMLYFSKSFDIFNRNSLSCHWDRHWLSSLTNKNLVILGAGHVAKQLHSFASCFNMNTYVMTRNISPLDWCKNTFDISSLNHHLSISDYLVVALPLTPLTKNLLNISNLSHLSSSSVLIDVSRGGVVSNNAMLELLLSKRIRGAALDVFEEEPLASDSPLWGLDNILLTPHVAGTSNDYFDRFLDVLKVNLDAYLDDSPLPNRVDFSSGY